MFRGGHHRYKLEGGWQHIDHGDIGGAGGTVISYGKRVREQIALSDWTGGCGLGDGHIRVVPVPTVTVAVALLLPGFGSLVVALTDAVSAMTVPEGVLALT